MKSFTLRLSAIALGAVLFCAPPVLAGCAELCDGDRCHSAENFPSWGCGVSGPVCFDYGCGPALTSLDRELMAKIEKAVAAGDKNLIALLAASADQPIRIHDKNGLLYDGFALAGLEGPGAAVSSTERLAACQSKANDASVAEAAENDEAATAATAVTANDR